MCVGCMTVSTQYAALGYLSHHGSQAIAVTLDHVGRVNNLARLGAVLGAWVYVIKLQRGWMGAVSADLASLVCLDLVSYLSRCHVSI